MKYLKKYKLFEILDAKTFDYKDWDELFWKLKSYPVKYKLTNLRRWTAKTLDNGLDTAINNSAINYFYQDYLFMKKKRSYILNIPANINEEPYNKVNEMIKYIDSVYVESTGTTSSLFGPSKGATFSFDSSDWKVKGCKLYLGILHNMLLYEDFFGGNDTHELVNKLSFEQTPENILALYNRFTDHQVSRSEYQQIQIKMGEDKTIRLIVEFTRDLYQTSKAKLYQRFDL